ncbi:MAG: hypothetical protein IPK20_22685 [Betaproteobacteria bacterium]|nr:hypothetical protein [Betaproteobacteria bacterium]
MAVGTWVTNAYQVSGNVGANGAAVDVNGVANAAPAAVYWSYVYAANGVGQSLGYQIAASDGTYKVRLHFAETGGQAVGARRFDVVVNGTNVDDNVDIRQRAGALNKAYVAEYDVVVSGGTGIGLDLVNRTNTAAILQGIELVRVNEEGVDTPTVELQVSTDDGANWRSIASGLTLDRRGQGHYDWTVDAATTTSNTARIRAIATVNNSLTGGILQVSDVSDEGFEIANAGQSYYVNDGSLAGDEYTTAVGSNANTGKSADAPMASLAALLRAYDLDAGDVIYVDTGLYNLATNVVLSSDDSGVTIVGASGHGSVLDRGNTTNGAWALQFAGADDVTLRGWYSGAGSTGSGRRMERTPTGWC